MISNQYSSRRNIVKAPIVCKPSPEDPPPTATVTLVPDILELPPLDSLDTVLTIIDDSKPPTTIITLTYSQEAGTLTGPPTLTNNSSVTLEYFSPLFDGSFQLKVVGRYPDGTIVIVFGLAIVTLD